MSFSDTLEDVVFDLKQKVKKEFKSGKPDEFGLDMRAGGTMYTDGDVIVVFGSTASLEYYGGFEYIDASHIIRFPGMTIFRSHNEHTECENRIIDAIDTFEGVKDEV